ncbi:MAG TPA: hypothetical protein VK589_28330 [Chryseolinea sp.]|nr:hypothetical protein [Chryseolinea sp.]
MQTTVTFDWSRNLTNELEGVTARTANHWKALSVSKVYAEQIQCLFNYGMNACNDGLSVKHCIVQCFLHIGARPELLTEDQLVIINMFKIFRRLLTQQKGMDLFQKETEMMSGLSNLQREALFLKSQCRLTYRDVADIMHLPIEQLHGHISKAMAILLRGK